MYRHTHTQRYGVRRTGIIPTVYSGCSSSAILVPTTTTAFMSLFQNSIRYVIIMHYKKEIAKQKLGFTMLNACCVSTDVGMYGCMEKLVAKDGFCIYLKNVLKIASISVGGHIIFNSERFDLCHCFKSTLQCERYLGCMQSRIYKTALARFRFGVSRINCHLLQFSAAFDLRNCPFLYYIDRR